LIFGIAGACRRKELCDLTVNDIQDTGEVLIVTLRDTKTHLDRKFTIIGEGFVVNPLTIYRKYASLRPVNTSHDRFFLFYNIGKCTRQPVGINTFGQLPSKIAAYLKLEDPKTYTGHCFRRSSATLLAAGGGDLVSVKRHGG
jgi:integrase